MTRTVADIRVWWGDLGNAESMATQDVRTLLAELDEANARADKAERELAELRAFVTRWTRVYGAHGLCLKQMQDAVAGTSPLLAEIAALLKETP